MSALSKEEVLPAGQGCNRSSKRLGVLRRGDLAVARNRCSLEEMTLCAIIEAGRLQAL